MKAKPAKNANKIQETKVKQMLIEREFLELPKVHTYSL